MPRAYLASRGPASACRRRTTAPPVRRRPLDLERARQKLAPARRNPACRRRPPRRPRRAARRADRYHHRPPRRCPRHPTISYPKPSMIGGLRRGRAKGGEVDRPHSIDRRGLGVQAADLAGLLAHAGRAIGLDLDDVVDARDATAAGDRQLGRGGVARLGLLGTLRHSGTSTASERDRRDQDQRSRDGVHGRPILPSARPWRVAGHSHEVELSERRAPDGSRRAAGICRHLSARSAWREEASAVGARLDGLEAARLAE